MNKEFISVIHRSLLGADIQFVHYKLAADAEGTEVTKIGPISVPRNVFANTMPAQPFCIQFMEAVLYLFKNRTESIRETHKEMHERPPTSKSPIDTSLFYNNIDEAEENLNRSITNQVASVYILCQDLEKSWFLIYIDLKSRVLYTLNPKFVLTPYDAATVIQTDTIIAQLRRALLQPYPEEVFECKSYPHQFYQPNEDNFSSGLYVFLMIYHLEMKCPISFRRCDLDKMRYNLAYWLLTKSLPY
jgi:hypothetical protein